MAFQVPKLKMVRFSGLSSSKAESDGSNPRLCGLTGSKAEDGDSYPRFNGFSGSKAEGSGSFFLFITFYRGVSSL